MEENHNPWAVPGIDAFNFLCCPECVYRSKEESSFYSHAIQNHPKSRIFFQPDSLQEIQIDPLFYCCPECNFRTKDVNMFQIHALENHPTSLTFFAGERSDDKSSKCIFPKIPIFRHVQTFDQNSKVGLFDYFQVSFDKIFTIYLVQANLNSINCKNFVKWK